MNSLGPDKIRAAGADPGIKAPRPYGLGHGPTPTHYPLYGADGFRLMAITVAADRQTLRIGRLRAAV